MVPQLQTEGLMLREGKPCSLNGATARVKWRWGWSPGPVFLHTVLIATLCLSKTNILKEIPSPGHPESFIFLMCLAQLIYFLVRIDSLGTDPVWVGISQTSSHTLCINFSSTAGDSSLTYRQLRKLEARRGGGYWHLGPVQFGNGIKRIKKGSRTMSQAKRLLGHASQGDR